MLCWANEDFYSRYQQKAPQKLKNLLLKSSIPIYKESSKTNSNTIQLDTNTILTNMAPPLKGQEITQLHKYSYLENHIFDNRLVKQNLLDKWPTADMNEYKGRKDHRNLMESYVLTTLIKSKY